MSIVSVGDTLVLATKRDSAQPENRARLVEQATKIREWQSQNQEELEALHKHSQQQGMEVRLHMMSQSNQIVIRFVEPTSGRVVREFPSEGLSQALAELQHKLTLSGGKLPLVDQRV